MSLQLEGERAYIYATISPYVPHKAVSIHASPSPQILVPATPTPRTPVQSSYREVLEETSMEWPEPDYLPRNLHSDSPAGHQQRTSPDFPLDSTLLHLSLLADALQDFAGERGVKGSLPPCGQNTFKLVSETPLQEEPETEELLVSPSLRVPNEGASSTLDSLPAHILKIQS
jgi:hypothetical protein